MVSQPGEVEGSITTPAGAPSETPEQVSDTLSLTEEQKQQFAEEYLRSRPDDYWTKHPYVNSKVQQIDARRKRQMEAENQRRQADAGAAANWLNQWNSLTPEQKAQAVEQDPRVGASLQRARELAGGVAGMSLTAEQAAKRIYDGIRETLINDERFADVPLDELAEQTAEVPELLAKVLDHGFKKREKVMQDEVKKMVEAAEARLRAEIHKGAERPERNVAGQSVPSGRSFTRQQIQDMTLTEFKALEAEIDQAAREGRIT